MNKNNEVAYSIYIFFDIVVTYKQFNWKPLHKQTVKLIWMFQDRSGLVQSMMSNRDMDVAKAWEAYSDKCKECEKLRDDLREAEQKVLKSQVCVF